jgi:hypothetical protein
MHLVDLFRQLSILVGLPAVLLAAAAAAAIVIARDWRIVLYCFILLSAMLSLLLSQLLPTEWALLQAIVGGLIAVMLFLSARQLRWRPRGVLNWEARWPQVASLSSFRTLAVVLAAVTFWAVRDHVHLPKVDTLFRDAILWLTLIGLLGLALHEEPLHAGLALLTVIGAFELLLFALVQDRMLVGLMEAGQLLLGLAISYLVVSHGLSGSPPQRDSGVPGWPA